MYDLNNGGFVTENGQAAGNDLSSGAVFDKDSAENIAGTLAEDRFLQVPLTQDFVNNLPFDLTDTAPNTPHSQTMDTKSARKGDFVVLTELGFYDEKYNGLTESSRPKVRSFELDYANLYNDNILAEQGTSYITEAIDDVEPVIIPISDVQQDKLRELDAFSPEKEPNGFFMQPIGDSHLEAGVMQDLGEALSDLETTGMDCTI